MGISGQLVKQGDLTVSGQRNTVIILMEFDIVSRPIMPLKETIRFSHRHTKRRLQRPSIAETRLQLRDAGGDEVGGKRSVA